MKKLGEPFNPLRFAHARSSCKHVDLDSVSLRREIHCCYSAILANEKLEEPVNPLLFVSRVHAGSSCKHIRVDRDSASLRRERHDSCSLILANENLEEPLILCVLFSMCVCEVAVNTFQLIWITSVA